MRLAEIAVDPAVAATIDLPGQTITAGDFSTGFSIDPFVKHRLLNGLDPIALTLENEDAIERFEAARPRWKPAIGASSTA